MDYSTQYRLQTLRDRAYAIELQAKQMLTDLDKLTECQDIRQLYAVVQFPDACLKLSYEIPPSLEVDEGDFVRVDQGVYAGWIGRVEEITTTPPNCGYCYPITEVVA